MRPLNARTMSRLPHFARACAPLALLTVFLTGCGGAMDAGAPPPRSTSAGATGVESEKNKQDAAPPREEEPSFMRVGAIEPPPPTAATAAPPSDVERKTESEGGTSEKKDKVRGAVVDSRGGLSEADVRAAIAEKRSSFRRCYDLGVSSAPGFTGSVTLRVAISPAGNVASADVVTSSTRNQNVDACVREEVRKLLFPSTGTGAVVAFPIEFGK